MPIERLLAFPKEGLSPDIYATSTPNRIDEENAYA
jgi:hypothetical protein